MKPSSVRETISYVYYWIKNLINTYYGLDVNALI